MLEKIYENRETAIAYVVDIMIGYLPNRLIPYALPFARQHSIPALCPFFGKWHGYSERMLKLDGEALAQEMIEQEEQ